MGKNVWSTYKLSFNAGKVYGNSLYFSDNHCNGLLKYDLINDCIEYVMMFPDDDICKSFLHRDCVVYKDNLYYTPNMSNYLSIYSPKDNTIKTLKLPRNDESKFCFCEGIINNNELYIVPGNTVQKLIKINLLNYQIEEMMDFHEVLDESPRRSQEFWKVTIINNILVLPRLNTGTIILCYLDSGKLKRFNFIDYSWSAAFYENDLLWLCSTDGRVFNWNLSNDLPVEIEVEKEEQIGCSFFVTSDKKNRIYLLPEYGKHFFKLSSSGVFEKKNGLVRKNSNILAPSVNYESYDIWNDSIVIYPRIRGNVVIIKDDRILERNASFLHAAEEYKMAYLATIKKECSQSATKEGQTYCLNDFLYMLMG